jgi:hypothetical protein
MREAQVVATSKSSLALMLNVDFQLKPIRSVLMGALPQPSFLPTM